MLDLGGLQYTTDMFLNMRSVSVEDAREIGASFAELAVRSKLFPRTPVHVHAIVSPTSGFFRHPVQVQETLSWLRMIVLDTALAVEPNSESRVSVHIARYKGHPGILAGEIVETLILREGIQGDPPYHFILSLGGDGTHQEILNTLVDLPQEVLERIIVFRLPMGTGNDGADTEDLASAAKCLLGEGRLKEVWSLRIQPEGFKGIYAFNIASIGIDAFVTHTANQLKTRFNTDIYRKIADVSVLFYPFLFPTRTLEMEITLTDGRVEQVSGKYVLAAFGVSGHRSYGNHKWILPGEENLCAILDRSFGKKLQLKNLLYTGKHVHQEGVLVRKARGVRLHYDASLFLQYDGEAIRLEKENFPCSIEIVPTRIRTLKGSNGRKQRLEGIPISVS